MDELKLDESTKLDIDTALDKYEQEVAGLPQLTKIECPKYLTMNIEDLRKKTPDELSEAIYLINQYALYIQRVINKNKAWQRWVTAKLDEIAASYIPDIGTAYGFNERILMAKNNPEICKRLNAFSRKILMELERLYDVPNNIRYIADSIRDIKFAALKRDKA